MPAPLRIHPGGVEAAGVAVEERYQRCGGLSVGPKLENLALRAWQSRHLTHEGDALFISENVFTPTRGFFSLHAIERLNKLGHGIKSRDRCSNLIQSPQRTPPTSMSGRKLFSGYIAR